MNLYFLIKVFIVVYSALSLTIEMLMTSEEEPPPPWLLQPAKTPLARRETMKNKDNFVLFIRRPPKQI